MDPFMELSIEMAFFTQQLRLRQIANEYHRRVMNQVRSQVWQPYASMDDVQYGCTPYLNNHDFGWDHHSNTSYDRSHNTLQSPQVQRSSLEKAMDELRRTQVESTMAQLEFSISMADMDNSQDGLPRFYVQNEMSQPPQEEMSNLEATIAELRREIRTSISLIYISTNMYISLLYVMIGK